MLIVSKLHHHLGFKYINFDFHLFNIFLTESANHFFNFVFNFAS